MSGTARISQLKDLFMKSPLASNVFFGFFFIVLEKLVEMEFVCPCDSTNKTVFTIGIFVIPPIPVFALIIYIQGYKKKTWPEWVKNVFFSSVPGLVWLILLFFDGQYFACLRTNWSGRYVIAPEVAPRKWCEPTNSTSSSGVGLKKTLQWYSQSQDIGMWIVVALLVVYGIVMCIYCTFKTEVQRTEDSPGDQSLVINIPALAFQSSVISIPASALQHQDSSISIPASALQHQDSSISIPEASRPPVNSRDNRRLKEEMDTTSKTEEAKGFEMTKMLQ